jgi:hypothetical protein
MQKSRHPELVSPLVTTFQDNGPPPAILKQVQDDGWVNSGGSPGMRVEIFVEEHGRIDCGVDLSRRQAGMAQ